MFNALCMSSTLAFFQNVECIVHVCYLSFFHREMCCWHISGVSAKRLYDLRGGAALDEGHKGPLQYIVLLLSILMCDEVTL